MTPEQTKIFNWLLKPEGRPMEYLRHDKVTKVHVIDAYLHGQRTTLQIPESEYRRAAKYLGIKPD